MQGSLSDVSGPQRRSYISKTHLWRVLAQSVFLLLLIANSSSPAQGIVIDKIWFYIAISFFALVVHFGLHERKSNWFRLDVLYLASFVVVNFQWALMYVLSGLMPSAGFFFEALGQNLTYATWLSALSMVSWMFGWACTKYSTLLVRQDRVSNGQPLLLAAFLCLIAFVLVADASYFSGEIYQTRQIHLTQSISGVGAYLINIVECLTVLAVGTFLYIGTTHSSDKPWRDFSSSVRKIGRTEKAIITSYCMVFSFIFYLAGERGQLVQMLIVLGVGYTMFIRPIGLYQMVVSIFITAIVFSFIALSRSALGAVEVMQAFGEFGIWSVSTNLAQSAITLYEGINVVQNNGGYFYGQLWISQILGVIPFLQSLFVSLTGLSTDELNSANKIAQHILGDIRHTGFGTSFVADIYMNFGVPGLIVISALFGCFLKKMANWISGRHGYEKFIIALVVFSLVIYIPRSSIMFLLRPVIWTWILGFLLMRVKRVI